MGIYSQNNEDTILLDKFKGFVGTLLSIGENSGTHLSNSLALIELGWSATLVEPSPQVFQELVSLHSQRNNVYCINVAVADYIGKADFYDSGEHIGNGDKALLSSLDKHEIKRWGGSTSFTKVKVDVVDFHTLLNLSPYSKFDFISVDAEGFDLIILKQINLEEIGCKCLCIEYNSNQESLNEILDYCARHGLTKMLLRNAENVILSV